MATVSLKQCDRCSSVAGVHYTSSITDADRPGMSARTDDLCDVCFELLLKFLDGAKLARPRAPK